MPDSSNQSTFEFVIEEPNQSGVLYFKGDLDIQQSHDLKKSLLESLDSVRNLRINLTELMSIDLVSIQTIYAAYQHAQDNNIEMEIDGKCPAVFVDTVFKAGLDRYDWLCFGDKKH